MSREDQLGPSFYRQIITDDGSPSLCLSEESGGEAMHSRRGALSESLYIYHRAMEHLSANNWPRRILSMGLGLGYNEWIAAAHAEAYDLQAANEYRILSFEKDQWLSESLIAFLNDSPTELTSTYKLILELLAKRFEIPAERIFSRLKFWHANGHWSLKSAFEPDKDYEPWPASCVLYDAFSNKTSPELWNETHIRIFLTNFTQTPCVLSTYAATGVLNRGLKENGFRLLPCQGFAGKRESTFAVKT